jgi:hypothetical protein
MGGRNGCLLLLAFFATRCGQATPPSGPSDPDTGPPIAVQMVVDSSQGRRAISPYIYGMNQFNPARAGGLRLGRAGGNRWTAYNWETNASNAGSDFHHQNDDFLGGGEVPGEAVRSAVAGVHAAGAAMIVTVPMAGYVSADKFPHGDVANTPDHLATRFFESRAAKRRGFAYPPDTGDRVVYQDEFVAWLESTFPYARQDPSRALFYSLDNEPDLWAHTHARIRPTGPVTYEEMRDRTIEYARAIKAAAPGALVFGPVSYGWGGYVDLQGAPDAAGRDFLDFYLASMRTAGAGGRLLDVLDVHWYPEARGGGQRVTESGTAPALAAARVQAPRSLWDPTYVETSWISQDAGVGAIRLLPRLQEKIAAHYPGTLLAVTEYNYGGGGDISGGLAQADVLGIFGREGVFAAALWDLQASSPFTDAAFTLFRNFDGAGRAFGDVSVAASTSHVADTSVYASVDEGSDGRMVLIVLNKNGSRTVRAAITLRHSRALGNARGFRLTARSAALQPVSVSAGGNALSLDLPPSSVTAVELLP